jgi:DNA-binding XRE family transcriptional regulator
MHNAGSLPTASARPSPSTMPKTKRARTSASVPSSGPLEISVGRTLRDLRSRQKLTLDDVAQRAGISKSMLSKIENGHTTSLDTLKRLSEALGVELSKLFQRFETPDGGAQHVKRGEGLEVVRRGTKVRHTYHLLAAERGPRRHFEPFLVTLTDKSEIFPRFEHPGTEFIYLLEGRILYRHGKETYPMSPGDALTFRGDIPHGPEKLLKLPIRLLSVIIYHGENGE